MFYDAKRTFYESLISWTSKCLPANKYMLEVNYKSEQGVTSLQSSQLRDQNGVNWCCSVVSVYFEHTPYLVLLLPFLTFKNQFYFETIQVVYFLWILLPYFLLSHFFYESHILWIILTYFTWILGFSSLLLQTFGFFILPNYPVNICLFLCSNLTAETPEKRHESRTTIYIVNFRKSRMSFDYLYC